MAAPVLPPLLSSSEICENVVSSPNLNPIPPLLSWMSMCTSYQRKASTILGYMHELPPNLDHLLVAGAKLVSGAQGLA